MREYLHGVGKIVFDTALTEASPPPATLYKESNWKTTTTARVRDAKHSFRPPIRPSTVQKRAGFGRRDVTVLRVTSSAAKRVPLPEL